MNIKRCVSLYLILLLLFLVFSGVVYAAGNSEFLEQSATENIDASIAESETEATATPSIPPKEEVVDTGTAEPETEATATPSNPPKEEVSDDSTSNSPTQANPPVLIGYNVSKSNIVKNNIVTINVFVKHTDVTAEQIGGKDNLDITKLVDSFSGGNVSVDITSNPKEMLIYKVTFSNVKYSGSGKSLRFMCGYKNSNEPFSTMELSVTETVEYEKPPEPQPTTPEAAPAPMVLISRGEMKSSLVADQEISVPITFHNLDSKTITSVVATFSPSESLLIVGGNSSFKLEDIPGQKSQTITLKVRATKTVTSEAQSLGVELKFNYDNNITITQGNCSDRIIIPAVVTNQNTSNAEIDKPVPNIVVSDYSYSKEAVSAGEKFPLKFTLQNTGNLTVENIVVTIDGGDSFTIDGSTNTFHYDKIGGGDKNELTVNMQALVSAKTGAQGIGISCKYEYLDSNKRSSATADIKLSVPVFQPDRFQVNAPAIPEMISVGEEVTLSLSYVNKGKADVCNVEAIVEGEVDTPAKTQYLGNFEPGKSGNIGFVFTPEKAGELKLILKINYEDANLDVQTLKFPVTVDVQEALDEPMYPDDTYMEEDSGNGVIIWGIFGGVLLTVFVVAIIIRTYRKRKRSRAELASTNEMNGDNWLDDDVDIFVESEESKQ